MIEIFLRNSWRMTKDSLSENHRISEQVNIDEKKKTCLQRLATRYKRFSLTALAFILISPGWIINLRLFGDHTLVMLILWCAYFSIVSISDYWFYNGIKKLDIVSISVDELIRRLIFYRKRHLQFIILFLPFVIGMIVYMSMIVSDTGFIFSIIIGAFIGLVLGSRCLIRFLSDYEQALSDN